MSSEESVSYPLEFLEFLQKHVEDEEAVGDSGRLVEDVGDPRRLVEVVGDPRGLVKAVGDPRRLVEDVDEESMSAMIFMTR